MSLVSELFDFVKTNPGVNGMNIQNHFSNNTMSDSISELEEINAIRWTEQGYFITGQQITKTKLSLEGLIDEVEKIIKDRISTTCPKCKTHVNGKQSVEKIFGFRKSNGKIITQSYCRKCRGNKMQGEIIVNGKTIVSLGSNYHKWKAEQERKNVKLIVPEIQNNNIKINLKEEREKTLYFEDHFKNSIIDSNDNVLQYMTQSGDTTKHDDFKF
jgi:hypothetical protein